MRKAWLGAGIAWAWAAMAGAASPPAQAPDWISAPVTPTQQRVDMRTLPPLPQWRPGDAIVEVPRAVVAVPAPPAPRHPRLDPVDPLLQRPAAIVAANSTSPPASRLSFDAFASFQNPNDPVGALGGLQYVMALNGLNGAAFVVYDKSNGQQVGSPATMASLSTEPPCEIGRGDPIVLYDALAQRWLLTQFVNGQNVFCIYLSDRDDLSAEVVWTTYAFSTPGFPDYPKYAVWPDAYLVGANEPGSPGQRPVYALDRARMLAGEPATLLRFTTPRLPAFGFEVLQPVEFVGPAPPAGTPGLFLRHRDDEVHNPAANDPARDFLELFALRANFAQPAQSQLIGPMRIAVSEFDSDLAGLVSLSAFPQPAGPPLDPLREVVMHRVQYRNFGSHEALVANWVTDASNDDTGGIRWVMLQRGFGDLSRAGFESADPPMTDTLGWQLAQEGTHAPSDGGVQADRWMGAIGIDAGGNLLLGYSIVRDSPAISVGFRSSGREWTDQPGWMRPHETALAQGSGNIGNTRWGDYHDLAIDPVSGCEAWMIGGFVRADARANRVSVQSWPSCGQPRFALSATPPNLRHCTLRPAPELLIEARAVGGFAGNLALSANTSPGVIAQFAQSTLATQPASGTRLSLAFAPSVDPGLSSVSLTGQSGPTTHELTVFLDLLTAVPATTNLLAPDGVTGVSLTPLLTWQAVSQTERYRVQLARDAAFTDLVADALAPLPVYIAPLLQPDREYHWRVRSENLCGIGPWRSASFRTGT